MKNNLLVTVIVAIVVAAIAFYGGITYQKSQASGSSYGQFAQNGQTQTQGRGGGRGRFGMATVGNVVSQDANSITVQLQDGSSKIVNITSNTTFYKTDTASKSDAQNGTRVAAFGTNNSDGSVTAQNIQINPQMGMRGGDRAGQQSQPSQSQ